MLRAQAIGFKLLLTYILFLPYKNDYTTDYGNGVTIKGDRYVKSGEWVYNCVRWHLISKKPRAFPIEKFSTSKLIKIYHHLSPPTRKQTAREFIAHVMNREKWYEGLMYTRTYINEDSQITSHHFELASLYKGEQWVLTVSHPDNLNINNSYSITADLYDARYDKKHAELLQDAKNSCAKPQ